MQPIKTFVKNGIFLSSLLGMYYLFVFTIYEKIPFPLDMSVLPTVLLALGILCLLFTLAALFYSSISVIVLTDPLAISYSQLFYTKPDWIRSKHLASVINFIFFFCLTPAVLFISSMLEYQWANELTILSLCISPLLFSYYSLTSTEFVINEKGRCLFSMRYWKTVATFLYIGFFALLSIFVFLKYVEFGWDIKSNSEYIVAIMIFIIGNYLILVPAKKKDAFQKNAQLYSKSSTLVEIVKIKWTPLSRQKIS